MTDLALIKQSDGSYHIFTLADAVTQLNSLGNILIELAGEQHPVKPVANLESMLCSDDRVKKGKP